MYIILYYTSTQFNLETRTGKMDEVKSKALFTVLKPSSEWESNPMVGEGGGLERTKEADNWN